LQIRKMCIRDVSSVMDIESRAYPHPWTHGIFRDCIRVGYSCHVLDWAGGVSGYSVVSIGAGEAHLLNLCVDPDLQGQGLGQVLLEDLLDRTRLADVHRLFLEVRPSNRPAIRLYRKSGFHVIGRRPGYYPARGSREDAMVMVCHFE